MSLDNVKYIKVFPGIGTARVGNSPEYFVGPEFPGDVPNLGKPYKDKNNLLKPQAAKFRVYGYDENNNVVAEITHDPENGVSLEWDVHMRNLKAANYAFQGKFGFNPNQYRNQGVEPSKPGTDPNKRKSLIIDPGARKISGVNLGLKNQSAVHLDGGTIFKGIGEAEIPTSLLERGATGYTKVTYKEKEVSLGRLETDSEGRLIVVGGKGEAGCLIEPPIILQKGTAIFDGVNAQIGVAQTTVDYTGTKPNTFYTNETSLEIRNLDQVSIKLAGNEEGTDPVAVHDVLNVYVTKDNQTTQVFTHDFRDIQNEDKVTPHPPFDITAALQNYLGDSVTIKIECVNVSSNQQGASAIWLTYINENPTSNGNSYFNNPGWYDDTAGGSINAEVTINGTVFTTKENGQLYGDPDKRGWVAVSPPKYVPTMNNVVSLLDLQLAMFPEADPVSGTVNFALLDDHGIPNFSPVSITNFNALSSLKPGKGSPSIARYNGKDYLAYTGEEGENLLAVSVNGASWTQVPIKIETSGSYPFGTVTDYAPSLCVFDGALNYVITVENGDIAVGTSTDGINFNFEITQAAITNPPTPYSTVIPSASAPSAIPYNGRLYIAYTDSDCNLVVAHKYLVASSTDYYYAFNSTNQKLYKGTSPSLAVFFGQLYCAYTGADQTAYIGNYSNYSPAPSEPTNVTFDFTKLMGASVPASKISPSIGSSHGKLYYAIIDSSYNIHMAIAKPGLYDVNFTNLGHTSTKDAISIANFSDIEFYRDVYPILKTVTDYAWVNEPAFHGHAPGKPGDFLRDNSLPYYSNPDGTNNVYRSFVFNFLREPEQLTPDVPPPPAAIPNPTNKTVHGVKPSIPDGGIQTGTLMPHLFGEGGSPLENGFNGTNYPNQWLSLTPHQLWKCQAWVNGNFAPGTKPLNDVPSAGKTFEQAVTHIADQPAALDFSALEPTVGGGFHPGIELTYYMKEPGFFIEPFRFADTITHNGSDIQAITPGSVAGYMSIPWQGDFWSCNISWWAAMRPDIVIPPKDQIPPPFIPWYRGEGVGIPANADNIDSYEGGYEHMVRYWSDFGYVVPTGDTDRGMFVMQESERNPCLDNTDAPCVAYNQPENAIIGAAYPATKSGAPTSVPFYTNKIDLLIPAGGEIILAGSADGTGQIFVDDEVEIFMCYNTWKTETVDGITTTTISEEQSKTTIFSHDFSNGNSGTITPIKPQNITEKIRSAEGYHPGTIVTIIIQYTDTYGVSKSASEFWLVYPTS